MADTCVDMSNDSGFPVECRRRRLSRKEMRRVTAISNEASPPPEGTSGGVLSGGAQKRRREEPDGDRPGGGNSPPLPSPSTISSLSSSSSSSRAGSNSRVPEAPLVPSTSRRADAVEPPPPEFGFVSFSGRSREMEDAVSLHPGFFSPRADGAAPLHFFAVFDGHGGTHVSELCKERMHVLLAEELEKAESSEHGGGCGGITKDALAAATTRCFRRMDELALAACACGSVGDPPCDCEQAAGLASQIVGSTAVAVVLDRDRVLVANCGDSRAVLSRGGRAVALSSDHKPDRPDELARIEAAGGRVIFVNGARVLGILAMSRALGDKYLKPIVIADPEISITERTPDDEFLIIASDGLWDVLSNDLACDVARRCLQDGSQLHAGAEGLGAVEGGGGGGADISAATEQQEAPRSYCSVAAALLTRLALGRKSGDNISVVVVDLRS